MNQQARSEKQVDGEHRSRTKGYGRFVAMVASSTVLMYAATYLNTYSWSHVLVSEMRAYMALLMGALMAVVMLTFMLHMLTDRRLNGAIYAGAGILFLLGLWLARSQRTIDDVAYMRGMIPHHSIAILTSERARISDPRVRELADQIIEAQRREIAEMQGLIDALSSGDAESSMPGEGMSSRGD